MGQLDIIDDRLTRLEAMVLPKTDEPIDQRAKQDAEAPDPWAHRSEGMRCRTCMWWVRKEGTKPTIQELEERVQASEPLSSVIGRCRRHAPLSGGQGFPPMFANDWCGDHRIDETKI